ncbi:ATPase, T2SS/T4P/T4SS family, partial [Tessaracoccus antarcticus]
MPENGHVAMDAADLGDLPLFNTPVGRRRGTFTMTPPPTSTLPPPPPPWPVTPSPPTVPQAATPGVVLQPRMERTVAGVLDWALVDLLRERVSDELAQRDLTKADREVLGREVIAEVLAREARTATTNGQATWTMRHQSRLADALFDAVFRMGRLQPYLDDDTLENVIISGYDNVILERADGTLVKGEPVANSDEDLISYLQFVASHQSRPRQFSETDSKLHLALPGRARLFASAWVTSRPTVIIRRNRLATAILADLVRLGSLSSTAASFLSAAVRGRLSVIVSGDQGTGKTTMLRALAHELPAHVQIGTIETEFELFLRDTGHHQVVHEWQANPGTG